MIEKIPNPNPKELTVYTDGSMIEGGAGGWAFLLLGELYSGWDRWTTNNEMEMMAILMAVSHASPGSKLHIKSDSRMAIGWCTAKMKCHSNPRCKQILDTYWMTCFENHLTVRFSWVKGHSISHKNGMVDREARRMAGLAKRYG